MSLNSQQEAALKQMLDFVLVSNDTYFVLDGMAGCGKTFLVSYFLERLAEIYITMKDINVEVINYTNMLCAPTHKAVDALKDATVLPAETIHIDDFPVRRVGRKGSPIRCGKVVGCR